MLAFGALAVGVVFAVVALQRSSEARYRQSVRTYDVGLEAVALNALSWTTLSTIDPVHFPGPLTVEPGVDHPRLDALLEHAHEHAAIAPPEAQVLVHPYHALIAEVSEAMHAGDTDTAFNLLSESSLGSTSMFELLIVELDALGDQYADEAHRTATYTVGASAGVIVLAVLAGGVGYTALRRSRRRADQHAAEREILRRSEARFRPLVHHSTDVIAVVDADGTFRYLSPAVERFLGFADGDLLGHSLFSLLDPADGPSLESLLIEVTSRPGYTASAEARLVGKDHETHDFEIVCTNLREDPDVAGLVLNMRDVSERKQMEAQLRRLAFEDTLTGLANRLRFSDRLEHALLRARRSGDGKVSVLYLDLDHFKAVNDELGHNAGDTLLSEVAARIGRCIRPADTAARLGGDEFAILLEDAPTAAKAREVADRLLEELAQPFDLDAREISLSASIGIVVADPATMTAEEVVRDADIAMYDAKESGRGRAHLFENRMHVGIVERARLVQELNAGLDNDEFVVYYQPTVDLATEQPVGFEALVRWRHPDRGLLSPEDFIQIAEETGAIIELGEQVLNCACNQLKSWQDDYPDSIGLTMSVNVSAKQIQRPGFVEVVERSLLASGIDPRLLTLEITESVLVSQPQEAVEILTRLKALGVRLALDDFGTGYSSLNYLKRFPIDTLKIDRSFVEGLDGTGKDRMLVQTVIDLGITLELDIVAEGIERPDQLAWLRTVNCATGQGYLWARPLESHAAELLVAKARLGSGRNGRSAVA
jgi:diguanylate cyclase (GGDEF)-like protein/PAS domain S-box-containing protein